MFNINGVSWQVIKVPGNYPKLFRSNGTLSIGSCDNSNQTIYINQNLFGNKLKKVLCHEITHAAMFSYGVTLTVEQEELVADLIATYGDEIINVTNKIFRKIKYK